MSNWYKAEIRLDNDAVTIDAIDDRKKLKYVKVGTPYTLRDKGTRAYAIVVYLTDKPSPQSAKFLLYRACREHYLNIAKIYERRAYSVKYYGLDKEADERYEKAYRTPVRKLERSIDQALYKGKTKL